MTPQIFMWIIGGAGAIIVLLFSLWNAGQQLRIAALEKSTADNAKAVSDLVRVIYECKLYHREHGVSDAQWTALEAKLDGIYTRLGHLEVSLAALSGAKDGADK